MRYHALVVWWWCLCLRRFFSTKISLLIDLSFFSTNSVRSTTLLGLYVFFFLPYYFECAGTAWRITSQGLNSRSFVTLSRLVDSWRVVGGWWDCLRSGEERKKKTSTFVSCSCLNWFWTFLTLFFLKCQVGIGIDGMFNFIQQIVVDVGFLFHELLVDLLGRSIHWRSNDILQIGIGF